MPRKRTSECSTFSGARGDLRLVVKGLFSPLPLSWRFIRASRIICRNGLLVVAHAEGKEIDAAESIDF